MTHRTVFLSSPDGPLAGYREAAYRAIEGLHGYHCVRMENFGALDWKADEFCRAKVAECDLFVGILGYRYGSCPEDSEKSYSEREYEAAIAAGIPRLMFLSSDTLPAPAKDIEPDQVRDKQRAFRERICNERIPDTFTSPNDLAGRVRQALFNWERQAKIPRKTAPIHDIIPQLDLYFQELDRLFAESRIDKVYVPLEGLREDLESISIDQHVESWLEDSTKNRLAVLGDYGTGKTWFCIRLAKRLLDRFRTAPDRFPLPLLITFRRYQPDTDYLTLIKSELLETYGADIRSPAALVRLLKSRDVILILDGMDEMAKKQGDRSALHSYYRLGLPPDGPKVIITCRTHYFYSGSEQREVINVDDKRLSIDKLPAFETVHLSLLDKSKIDKSIEGRFDKHARAVVLHFINSTYNLRELCARPILLSLVCDSYELLSEIKRPISAAVLYEEYVRAWLRRELMNGRLILDPDKVTTIIEDLAHDMVDRDTLVLEPQELQPLLSAVLDRAGIPLERWPEIHRQLITSTFIRRSASDKWEFAHRSFQEFFYARKFFRWEQETGGKGEFPVVYIPIWNFVAELALERWDEAKALQWIPARIDRYEDLTFTLTTLRAAAAYWLLKRGSRPACEYPLAGVMLDCVALVGVNLAGCDLSDADFSLADLRGACMRNARLDRAYSAGARLAGVEWQDASIDKADFRGADFGDPGSDAWTKSLTQLKQCKGKDTAVFDEMVAAVLL
jgi:hypothetical protein